jgi:hypothetical protein
MTTSHSPAAVSPSSSNGESLSSLPRWRQFLSILNWRRDPGYEQRLNAKLIEIERIKTETEQLRRENARQKALSALIKQHCFPPESNSTPIPPIEPGSSSS